jgi:hypothetical protein
MQASQHISPCLLAVTSQTSTIPHVTAMLLWQLLVVCPVRHAQMEQSAAQRPTS